MKAFKGLGVLLVATTAMVFSPRLAKAILIKPFNELPAGEQSTRIANVLRQMVRKYNSDTDTQGNPKSADVTEKHRKFAAWIKEEFLDPKVPKTEEERLEKALDSYRSLLVYLSVMEKHQPDKHMEELVVTYVTEKYNEQLQAATTAPTQPAQ